MAGEKDRDLLGRARDVTTTKDATLDPAHYNERAIQPIQYIMANGLYFAEGCVIKYVSRWRKKNGVEDLKKARVYLDFLIKNEEAGAPL